MPDCDGGIETRQRGAVISEDYTRHQAPQSYPNSLPRLLVVPVVGWLISNQRSLLSETF